MIKEYMNVFCEDYPFFINKYIENSILTRLNGIGFFCGVDYSKIYNVKYWYSRFDHSIVSALMTWNFTKDKQETIAALFHDVGTPTFSHTIDYLFDDRIKQQSSEKSLFDMILGGGDSDLICLLKEDNLTIKDITDLSNYPILENERPKLCVDRLDGVLHTGLIWLGFWSIEDVKEIYDDIIVLNDNGKCEIGFQNIEIADKFFDGVFKYSIALQSNEDKFCMQFISDILKTLVEKNKLKIEDLYTMSESEIISIIANDLSLRSVWNKFRNANKVIGSTTLPKDYSVSFECKKRYVIPLCLNRGVPTRLNELSSRASEKIEEYLNYKSDKYAYVKGIRFNDKRSRSKVDNK